MKKTLLIFAVLLITSSAAFSQEFKFGAGGVLGTKASSTAELGFGIEARGLYEFTEEMNFVGGLTYYFPGDGLTHWEINADFQYEFTTVDDFTIYALGGINYTKFSEMNGKIGFAVGIGTTFNKFYVEGRYESTSFDGITYDQLKIGFGMYF